MVEILESTTDMVGFSDPGGTTLYINPAGRRMLGLTPDQDITKMNIGDFVADPATSPTMTVGLPTAMRDGTWSGETTLVSRSGQEFPASQVITGHKFPDGRVDYFSTIIRDLSEVKRLGAHLIQSQKLETVGRLAGGIAHEFNSILTAIIGQSEFLLSELPARSPLVQHATEIRTAADRAASLTARLLAYGRQQTLFPVTLDLNQTAQSMETMLRHLLGSHVDIRFVFAADLHAVRADAGQIEQVIVNLIINARDAMPDGGKVTVETANVTLGEASAGLNPDLEPGDYVMLAITDTGMGMSEDVKRRIFEPFFTTKDIGLGTGLGLSSCDGIIKQSGGYIGVYSEPKVGTVFKVYLPRNDRPAGERPASREAASLPRGTERILLVEDDRALREMAAELLRRLGYVVLDADGGANALKLAEDCGDTVIDLLFTDVVMPEISGTELADRIHALRPMTKTLFTSAYTENAIAHQRMLNSDAALLEKPFTPSALAIKVREVLDRRAA
jgi:PAS domain S-box-containing protein